MISFKRIIVLLSVLLAASSVSAQDIGAQKEKKDRLEKEIAILESQLRDNASKSSNALTSLTLTQKKISARKKLLAQSERQVRVLNDSITSKQRQINAINARLDTMNLYYERLVRNAYKNRDARVWYMYILASDDIGQASRRFNYLRGLSSQMNVQARKIQQAREELEAEKARLSDLRKEARELRDARAEELKQLQKEEKQSKNLVNQLNKNKSTYQKQLNTKKRQVEALNREIERIIKSAIGGNKKADVDYKLADEFSANKGKLPWPVDGPVVEHFGKHKHPVYTRVEMPFNNGVNIAVNPGTQAKAVFDGVVKQVIVMPGYNQCVLVQHGNYFTFYCKLASVAVKAGQKITTGQALGRIDTISGETQLHFQLWKERAPQDPEVWLRPRD
ncbi:MAG: peptidoglycan DD-metalloendopeptidase family protein [Bacteroidales bacterium]|nr:peptidoglycan DD-metalloendopeptidase family protein [Bacteroidales bacterium]